MSQEHLDRIRQMLGVGLRGYEGGAEMIAEVAAADEQIIAAETGGVGKTNVVLCATDKRLIIAGKALFLREYHEFPYSRISSLDVGGVSFGMVGMQDLRINAGGGGISVRVYSPRGVQSFISAVNGQIALLSEPQGHVESSADAAAALERLARLHRDGAISDEEFATKKADLLDRI
jgi:hypothetical protein